MNDGALKVESMNSVCVQTREANCSLEFSLTPFAIPRSVAAVFEYAWCLKTRGV